jgi:hypothetical protein
MNFRITIKHDRKNIRLLVEKISETKTQEKYKVIARTKVSFYRITDLY